MGHRLHPDRFAEIAGAAAGTRVGRCAAERARAGEAKTDRGIYFDFLEFERNILNNQTPNTPAVSLMYALAAQLDHIRQETLEARWRRHQEMADRTYEWIDEMNERGIRLSVMAPEGYRSPTVTTITVPEGWTGQRVAAEAKQRGFVIATGYGRLKDETSGSGTWVTTPSKS